MPLWQELPLLLVVAFCLAFLIRTFLVQAFYIPSGSMENTLLIGDRVLVNKVVYDVRDPQRGEIVVFRGTDNWAPENRMRRRTTALAPGVGRALGDLVGDQPAQREGLHQAGHRAARRHGALLRRAGSGHRQRKTARRAVRHRQLTAGRGSDAQPAAGRAGSARSSWRPGNMLVMGDHRLVSQDSRCQGQVPIENIIGKAFVIVWPSGRWATLGVPPTFEHVPSRRRRCAAPSGAGCRSVSVDPTLICAVLVASLACHGAFVDGQSTMAATT